MRKVSALDLIAVSQRLERESNLSIAIGSTDNWEKVSADSTGLATLTAIQALADAINEQCRGVRKTAPVENSPFDFEYIYRLYPRKLGKKRGIQLCIERIKDQHDYDRLKSAVVRYSRSVFGHDEKFIKHFSTFMNSWEDWAQPEPEAVVEVSL